jgi:hypothetical protein
MEQQGDPGTETSGEAIQGVIQEEARKLSREIEERFTATGELELPHGQ